MHDDEDAWSEIVKLIYKDLQSEARVRRWVSSTLHRMSPKSKERMLMWQRDNRERVRASNNKYASSPKGMATKRKYRRSDRGKDKQRVRKQRYLESPMGVAERKRATAAKFLYDNLSRFFGVERKSAVSVLIAAAKNSEFKAIWDKQIEMKVNVHNPPNRTYKLQLSFLKQVKRLLEKNKLGVKSEAK